MVDAFVMYYLPLGGSPGWEIMKWVMYVCVEMCAWVCPTVSVSHSFCVTSVAGRHIGIDLAIVVVVVICVGVGSGDDGGGGVVVVRFSG